MIGTPLLLFLLVISKDKPAPKFPIGKETTYVTGPLDKEGYIDYETALNERLGKGITPEMNANALLWKVLGPTPEGDERMPAEYFKRLGIKEPPKDGAYYIELGYYLMDTFKLDFKRDRPVFDVFFDQQDRAKLRPWTAEDYPEIAAWLKANDQPLAVVLEATRRPDYFNPLVSRRTGKKPGFLTGIPLADPHKFQQLARALAARAMLRVGEGKFDEAWHDLLACHRLGRLVARGATLIDGLVGIGIDQTASNADLAYLELANLTRKQIQDRLKDLQRLSPIPPLADKIDLGERFLYLDSLQLIRRGGLGMMLADQRGEAKKPDTQELKALEKIDWVPALRNGNRWYDRLAAALRLKDRAERQKALDKIEQELRALKEESAWPDDFADKMAGKAIGAVLIGMHVPGNRRVRDAYDRVEQRQRNVHLAFALAAYHRDHGRYPAKLDDLAPKYLAVVPDDIFSGKPLIFRPAENGYLLYSVGMNGKDEGGRSFEDDPPGDDVSLRMPLPELKKKK